MAKPGNVGLKRIILATRYSAQGLRQACRFEAAFRQEVVLTVVLIPVAIWLGESPLDYAALIGSLLLVLIVELLNSAIEAAIDRHGDEIHELSGRAKDFGSAAVFLSLVLVLVIWSAIAWERLLAG